MLVPLILGSLNALFILGLLVRELCQLRSCTAAKISDPLASPFKCLSWVHAAALSVLIVSPRSCRMPVWLLAAVYACAVLARLAVHMSRVHFVISSVFLRSTCLAFQMFAMFGVACGVCSFFILYLALEQSLHRQGSEGCPRMPQLPNDIVLLPALSVMIAEPVIGGGFLGLVLPTIQAAQSDRNRLMLHGGLVIMTMAFSMCCQAVYCCVLFGRTWPRVALVVLVELDLAFNSIALGFGYEVFQAAADACRAKSPNPISRQQMGIAGGHHSFSMARHTFGSSPHNRSQVRSRKGPSESISHQVSMSVVSASIPAVQPPITPGPVVGRQVNVRRSSASSALWPRPTATAHDSDVITLATMDMDVEDASGQGFLGWRSNALHVCAPVGPGVGPVGPGADRNANSGPIHLHVASIESVASTQFSAPSSPERGRLCAATSDVQESNGTPKVRRATGDSVEASDPSTHFGLNNLPAKMPKPEPLALSAYGHPATPGRVTRNWQISLPTHQE